MECIERKSVGSAAMVVVLSLLVLWAVLFPASRAFAAIGSGHVLVMVAVQGGTAHPDDFTLQIKQNGSPNTGTISGSAVSSPGLARGL